MVERRIALAQAAAVRAVGEDVHLRRHAGLHQRLIEAEALLDRNRLVGKGVIDERGRRVFGDE